MKTALQPIDLGYWAWNEPATRAVWRWRYKASEANKIAAAWLNRRWVEVQF
jgi:hypothetical protein